MSIAVIIPARNAERVLPRTLAALERSRAQVVVVDNGSRDATAQVAARRGARVVVEPEPSRPRARNAGAAAVPDARKLLFLDADCVPDRGWVDALGACLDEHALAGGPVVVEGGATTAARFDALWRLRNEETIRTQGWAGSGNLAIRRALFDELGGFDERFRHAGEDVDLCLRAPAIAFCAEAVVRHPPAETAKALVQRAFRHGYGSTQLHHRHAGRIGRQDWKHPRPALAGDWALARFGLADHPELRAIARLDYAGRVAGSAWAELRRAR